MRSLPRVLSVWLAAVIITFFCSCDKHHLDEYPAVQKEHVIEPGHESKGTSEHAEHAKPAESEVTATPAEFFPEKKSP